MNRPPGNRRIHASLLALVVLGLATAAPPVGAQTPFLVKDIDTTGEPFLPDCGPQPCPPPNPPFFGGLPADLTPWGDLLAFTANDREHGFEPWVSDGTPGGTRLLADMTPGEEGSYTVFLGAVDEDLLFWSGGTDYSACGLWRADRETLTVEPLDLGPDDPFDGGPADPCLLVPTGPAVPFEGSLFFEVGLRNPGGGRALARSDGTAGGTAIVQEICSAHSPCYSAAPRQAVLGPSLFVGTVSGLWRLSDPDAEPVPFDALPCVGELTPVPGTSAVQDLFFVSGCQERSLHHLLPDPAGPADTEALHTFERLPNGAYPEPAHLTWTDAGLYFVVYLFDPQDGAEIWKVDGTGGPRPVVTGFRRHGLGFPGLTAVGDRLVFGGTPQASTTRRLYAVAPDEALVPLTDGPAFLNAVTSVGSRAILGLETPGLGGEPWHTDGTPTGTALLGEVEPGPAGSGPREPTRVGDLVFFSAQTEELGRELWAIRLAELPPAPPPPPFGEWIESPAFPDFRFQVRISLGSEFSVSGSEVLDCQDDTVCVSGAVPGRPEVYLRILGPRPNGFLWPTIIRFTPSRVEVWVERESTGQMSYYDLPAVGPGEGDLPGRQDRRGFTE